jgi:hypothetical protein
MHFKRRELLPISQKLYIILTQLYSDTVLASPGSQKDSVQMLWENAGATYQTFHEFCVIVRKVLQLTALGG